MYNVHVGLGDHNKLSKSPDTSNNFKSSNLIHTGFLRWSLSGDQALNISIGYYLNQDYMVLYISRLGDIPTMLYIIAET